MKRQPTGNQVVQPTQCTVLDRLSGYNYLHGKRFYVFLFYVCSSFVPIVGTIWILINFSRRRILSTVATPPPLIDEVAKRRKERELMNLMPKKSKMPQAVTRLESISVEAKTDVELEMDLDELKNATYQAIKRHET